MEAQLETGACGIIRALYDWTLKLAQSKGAPKALAGISFAESSFFPIPPDTLLIPMVIAERAKWFRFALICTVSSILGAFLGYAIGALAYDYIGQPILAFYGKEDSFEKIANWYNKWGGWGVLAAAVTPFPYKVLTIFSGATGLNFITFTAVSIVGRAARFYLVAYLLYRFGAPIQQFIEKRLNLVFVVAMVLLIGGFAAVKLIA